MRRHSLVKCLGLYEPTRWANFCICHRYSSLRKRQGATNASHASEMVLLRYNECVRCAMRSWIRQGYSQRQMASIGKIVFFGRLRLRTFNISFQKLKNSCLRPFLWITHNDKNCVLKRPLPPIYSQFSKLNKLVKTQIYIDIGQATLYRQTLNCIL